MVTVCLALGPMGQLRPRKSIWWSALTGEWPDGDPGGWGRDRPVAHGDVRLGPGRRLRPGTSRLRLSRRLIYKHVDRTRAAGVAVALRDRPPGAPTDDHARRQSVGALGGLHQAQGPRVGGRTLGSARLWPSTFGAQPRPPDTPRWLGPPNRPSLPSCATRPFAHTKSNATENDGIRSLSGR